MVDLQEWRRIEEAYGAPAGFDPHPFRFGTPPPPPYL